MNDTIYDYYQRVIDHLNEAADSVSSQSLSDIQATLREAAACIKKLSQEVRMLEVDTEPISPYHIDY